MPTRITTDLLGFLVEVDHSPVAMQRDHDVIGEGNVRARVTRTDHTNTLTIVNGIADNLYYLFLAARGLNFLWIKENQRTFNEKLALL